MNNTVSGFRLSPHQEHVWLLQHSEAGLPARAWCVVEISGALDPERLEKAVETTISRHEILRTSFESLEGMATPLQVVAESGSNGVEWSLTVLSQSKHELLVSVPAMCADAETLKNLVFEIGQHYAGEAELSEPFQYVDYAEWQHEALSSEEAERVKAHTQLEVDQTDLSLPFEKSSRQFDPVTFVSVIPAETVRQLGEIGSLSSCLLAAYFVLLARLTEQSRLSVGVSFNGRNYEELVEALGLFARFLPINAAVGGDFVALLAAVDEQLAAAEQWQELYVAEGTAAFCFAYEAEAQPQWQVREDLQFRLVQSRA
ncbi:MAG TPA: condensation domain-containing protein, partial [Pyrinomonadaceae bacterium]